MNRPDSSSLQPMRRLLARAAFAIAVLAVATAAILGWYHYGMERSVDLLDGRYPLKFDVDPGPDGPSEASLARRGKATVVRCRMVYVKGWSSCKLSIDLMQDSHGMDLSAFDDVVVDVRHTGPGPARLSLTAVNIEEGLTILDQWQTYKINQMDALDVPEHGSVRMPLKWFGVAQWWRDLVRPSIEHSYVRLDNVARLEVVFAWAPEGEHEYVLDSIRLRGKLVSENRLLQGVIGLWFACALAWLGATALSLRRQLGASDAERAKLAGINAALKLEARELAGQAHHDPLTGVLNRQGLRAELMNTSTLLSDPASIIFIDIDHFKSINDTHGHGVGDEVLRMLAGVIAGGIRQSDRLVRWGGEEFLIVCALTDVHQASALAEKLRRQLHEAQWPAGLAVTASFGVAQHHRGVEMGVAIHHADAALYHAKTGGRDRVQAFLGDG